METTYLRLTTLVLAIFTGVVLSILSRHLRIPAIVLLLTGGIILGPEVLGIINPEALGEEGLRLIISLSVAVILFEGGLTLRPEGIKKLPHIIWKLLTFGVVITWFGTALFVYLIFNFSISLSLLAGSLIIVTGPTVITPLLQRIKVKKNIQHILHWESVLIDPIGVFIAVLCFEWLTIEGHFLTHIGQFSLRILTGVLVGITGGKVIIILLKKRIIPEQQTKIFTFATALFLFGISDLIAHESGILTVVISGFIIRWNRPPGLKYIQQFKSELTEISIALVFILLAATLELSSFTQFGWKIWLLLFAVLFVVRPLNIFLCSYKSTISFKEKLFLSWIAPRGIIAGSMASIFTLKLMSFGHENAKFLEIFTFSVIGITIIFQGMTASKIARFLKVEESEIKGWLIIGAHYFSRKIADFISETSGGQCILVDTNEEMVSEAHENGYSAYQGNALSYDVVPAEKLGSIGKVLALTDNRDLNQLICEKWSKIIATKHTYRWSPLGMEFENKIGGKGTPIWSNLGKPSKVAYDLMNKGLILSKAENSDYSTKLKSGFENLISVYNEHFFFEKIDSENIDNQKILLIKKLTKQLFQFVKQEQILWLKSTSYEKLITKILTEISKQFPKFPIKTELPKLIEREKKFPTVLSNGVAVPHLHCSGIERSICFIGLVSKGIKLKTHDGEPVQLLFVLLSPENDPENHLILLAEIAKIASIPEISKQLISSKDTDEIIRILKNIETYQ